MFSKHSSQCEIQGRKITVETGGMARQADSAVYAGCGDTRVLAAVVSAKKDSDLDYFPLMVEYQEKFYSVGRVPGGFFKREGRPSYEATLCARLIDRPIRPCFPENYRKDTQIAVMVLSSDGGFPPEILGGIAASTALHISDIPFAGPVAFLKAARQGGKLVLNPNEELEEGGEPPELSFITAGAKNGLLMVEGEASFVSEAQALEALKFAHESMAPILDMQEDLRRKTGSRPKRELEEPQKDEALFSEIRQFIQTDLEASLKIKDKTQRGEALDQLKEKAMEKFAPEGADEAESRAKAVSQVYGEAKYETARRMITESAQRIDGRKHDEIRPIACETDILPRSHGSALFTRGETQVLGTVTLGTGDDEKIIDNLWNSGRKQFFLHYNFPPFCVGETGRFGGQSRREIGHGFLAEKALKKALPSHEDFPYTIRIVSEVLESNGSSSMGTVCSGAMALMAAGVPISAPVAGVAMGLIKGKDKAVVLSDILGDEDHLGDMDFKVAGSEKGIAAIQMDIKTDNIDFQTMEKALRQARDGRLHILKEMEKAIARPKEDLSPYAPRIETLKIPPEKIREVIGSGGKMINSITEQTGVKIDINDDGTIFVCSPSKEGIAKAIKIIEGICEEPEEGKVYEGVVRGVKEFGAFVEILPNTQGLLHVSQISHERVDQVSDVFKEGDKVTVKVLNVEAGGRIRLSAKALKEGGPGDDSRDSHRDSYDRESGERQGRRRPFSDKPSDRRPPRGGGRSAKGSDEKKRGFFKRPRRRED